MFIGQRLKKNDDCFVKGEKGLYRVVTFSSITRAGNNLGLIYTLEDVETGKRVAEMSDNVYKTTNKHDDIVQNEFYIMVENKGKRIKFRRQAQNEKELIEIIAEVLIAFDFEQGVGKEIKIEVIKGIGGIL